jgi:hypothetical protein
MPGHAIYTNVFTSQSQQIIKRGLKVKIKQNTVLNGIIIPLNDNKRELHLVTKKKNISFFFLTSHVLQCVTKKNNNRKKTKFF